MIRYGALHPGDRFFLNGRIYIVTDLVKTFKNIDTDGNITTIHVNISVNILNGKAINPYMLTCGWTELNDMCVSLA